MDKDRYNWYLEKMRVQEAVRGDYEASHYIADDLLIDFIKELGYVELADSFDNVGKWYS